MSPSPRAARGPLLGRGAWLLLTTRRASCLSAAGVCRPRARHCRTADADRAPFDPWSSAMVQGGLHVPRGTKCLPGWPPGPLDYGIVRCVGDTAFCRACARHPAGWNKTTAACRRALGSARTTSDAEGLIVLIISRLRKRGDNAERHQSPRGGPPWKHEFGGLGRGGHHSVKDPEQNPSRATLCSKQDSRLAATVEGGAGASQTLRGSLTCIGAP